MAFRPTEDGCRFVLQWVSGGLIRATNHFWFKKADFDHTDMENLATAFWAGWNANDGIKDVVPTTVRWTAKLVDERTYDGEVLLNDPVNIDGEYLTGVDEWNSALVLSLFTGKRGRAYRGRLYFAGLAYQEVPNGIYSQACADALMTSIDAMNGFIIIQGWDWSVRTSQVDHVQVNPAQLSHITDYQIRSLIPGSQRRRSLRP